jgi:thiosulfate/3-mercaptopyruvate sulfurtransferase
MTYPNAHYLTEPQALAASLDDARLRVFDATVHLVPADNGYRAESGLVCYQEGHVPGAMFMDLIRAFSDTTTGLGFSLPAPSALEAAFRAIGVDHDSRIVFYSTGHMMWATRAFWLAHYAGLENIAVLNGGLRSWQAAGLPVSREPARHPPGRFTIRPRPDVFVDQAGMQANLDGTGVCVVNALSQAVYEGTGDMHYGRRGHLPGSINLHYDDLLADGAFRPAAELEASLAKTGMLDADRVITYCGGGISATIDAFACLLLGKDHRRVAVYDGSMSEWARDPSLPLTTGAAP